MKRDSRIYVTFNDEYMLAGARLEAEKQHLRLSQYIIGLVRADLQSKLQYKIVSYQSDGAIKEETEFYTGRDLMESVRAYKEIFESKEPLRYYLPKEVYLIGYEVWSHGVCIDKKGVTEGHTFVVE